MSNFMKIYYRAFSTEPFAPDAIGYVEEENLIDGLNDNYLEYPEDSDNPVPSSGYIWVYENEDGKGEFWLINSKNVYTEVVENSALEGGYGMPYPAGGLTSTNGYDLEHETEDGEIIYLKRYHF